MKCSMDVPAVIFIRLQQPVTDDHPVKRIISAHSGIFVEENDDVVSVLADNPDEDDVAVLPLATYDVLANIFDEIYKDDGEVEYEDALHDDVLVVMRTQADRAS
jgi:hypothetical protein